MILGVAMGIWALSGLGLAKWAAEGLLEWAADMDDYNDEIKLQGSEQRV